MTSIEKKKLKEVYEKYSSSIEPIVGDVADELIADILKRSSYEWLSRKDLDRIISTKVRDEIDLMQVCDFIELNNELDMCPMSYSGCVNRINEIIKEELRDVL